MAALLRGEPPAMFIAPTENMDHPSEQDVQSCGFIVGDYLDDDQRRKAERDEPAMRWVNLPEGWKIHADLACEDRFSRYGRVVDERGHRRGEAMCGGPLNRSRCTQIQIDTWAGQELRIPDLEWEPPSCPRCGNATRPLRIIGHDGRRTEWRCDTCRLEWDSGGTNGHPNYE